MQSDTGLSRCHGPSCRGASAEIHRHLARRLILQCRPRDWHFPNLQALSIAYHELTSFTSFLERHASHLRTITLECMVLDSMYEYAAVLSRMPILTELVISYCYQLPARRCDELLKLILMCQKLERLQLKQVILQLSPSLALPPLAKLVHLTYLHMSKVKAESVAAILPRCPSLKTLSWSTRTHDLYPESDRHLRAIVQAIQQCCLNLEHIEDLELFRGAEGEDAWFLADLVRSVKQLRTFTTTHNYHVPWSHDLLKALLAHQDTLEVIRTPTATVSPWMRIKRGRKIDPTLALLPSTAASVLNNTDDACEQESSWSLPPITTACSKRPSIVSTLLYQCSRLKTVELPYVGLEHFGALSQQYCGQAWKCRASLQQLIFTRAQHMVHLSLKRLSKHKNVNLEPETEAEGETIIVQLHARHLAGEGNSVNNNTAKAQRVQAMMDDLAQQLELCSRLRLFSVGKRAYKSFR
ncbi:hypothetical protein BGZ73_008927 [Actinomortierella ambigua]|nr:hypothetical protein BGZ73_008927 [Actinomortierella ambigua]